MERVIFNNEAHKFLRGYFKPVSEIFLAVILIRCNGGTCIFAVTKRRLEINPNDTKVMITTIISKNVNKLENKS